MIGKHIHLSEIDSTNDFLLRLQNSGENIDNYVVSADFQTKGKGQSSNIWHSEANKNLLFSVVLSLNFLEASRQFILTQAVSTAIIDVLENLIPNKNFSIKWPNDIYFENKKIAGILISNTINGNYFENSIVGIGFNLNETVFPEWIPNPVSLKQISNTNFDRESILFQLVDAIHNKVDLLKNTQKAKKINSDYVSKSFRFGKICQYVIDKKTIEAKITGFDEYGHLQLEDKNKKKYCCDLKEIEFVI